MTGTPQLLLAHHLKALRLVLSDECELVSVCQQIGLFMQHKVAAIQRVRLRVLICNRLSI